MRGGGAEDRKGGEWRRRVLGGREEQLSRLYQVSRMTARQALQALKHGGYAVSERGRGTYVTKPKLVKSILLLQSFTEQLRKSGITPSSRCFSRELCGQEPSWRRS